MAEIGERAVGVFGHTEIVIFRKRKLDFFRGVFFIRTIARIGIIARGRGERFAARAFESDRGGSTVAPFHADKSVDLFAEHRVERLIEKSLRAFAARRVQKRSVRFEG